MKNLIKAVLFGTAVAATCACAAPADSYPNKPIRIIVPFAAGGGGDFIVRAWSDKFAAQVGQPVIVDNRGGGNTVIGTEAVSTAAPDGYTLLIVSPSFATNPTLLPKLPYKTPDDFTPVGLVITYAMGLAARSSLDANNIQELLSLASKTPTRFTIATSGKGSASHLAAELLRDATGLNLLNVPYRGAGPALLDVASGHVDMSFTGLSQIKAQLDTKRVKLLGTSGKQRLKSAPDTPTIAEQGIKNFEALVWWGILAPAGTPPDIVQKINHALKQSLSDPEVTQRLAVIDGEVQVSTPEAFGELIKNEIVRWRGLLADDVTTTSQ